jgi:hypothetical protein
MATFTFVAIRLIGIWLIASSTAGLLVNASVLAFDVVGDLQVAIIMTAGSAIPILLGVGLVLFSRRISTLVLGADASETSVPIASEQVFTRIGLFLIGSLVLVETIPRFVGFATAPENPYWIAPIEEWISLAIGLLLVLGSGILAGLIGKLRRWSPSAVQRETGA